MSTKPKLKLIPLPSGLAKLPKGAVFLGRGGEKLDQAKASPFDAWTHLVDEPDPEGWEHQIGQAGCAEYLYYAAPRDSAIAREILGVREAPKKAKKAPALRKLPRNVKPGTKVVCVDAEDVGGELAKGSIYKVLGNDGWFVRVNGITGAWSKYRFRLAPEKKPLVQRSKRIGVMPAAKTPAQIIHEANQKLIEKFGRLFVRNAIFSGIDLPDWLPALPPVPAGFDRWEPRGMGWKSGKTCTTYANSSEKQKGWRRHHDAMPLEVPTSFYIEAVRDEKIIERIQMPEDHVLLGPPYFYSHEEIEAFRNSLKPQLNPDNSAVGLLTDAAQTIGARAQERDVESERSMAKCVAAFNVMFGQNITEEQGWLFMVLLKMSRSTVGHRRDDFLDGAAYLSLAGECALNQTKP